MNKRHYEHTLPNIRGSLSNTYAYFRGEEENGQKFCDMITRQVERYTQNRRRTG